MDRVIKYFSLPGFEGDKTDVFSPVYLRYFFLSLFQFSIILFIVWRFQFEKSSGVLEYIPLILTGFICHSFLPFKFRPAALSVIAFILIYWAFGLLAGSIIISTGISIIIICHLPIKFNYRLCIILGLTCMLALLRTGFIYIPWLIMTVMYLAPMFMFRLIVYLYEIKHYNIPASKWQSIAYFFLFPNIFFLFFPIIDYKTYVKTYHNCPMNEVWQKGIRWMLRGIIHILCYRLICYSLLIDVTQVNDLLSLLHYAIINYSLILRLSGIFYFAVGLLCMFGLNLPQVFDNYFLATSFVDLWRRINIYWRDFILKVFFYPIMFRYKKKIKKNLLAITMMTVFVITWMLHSYQLFWITGEIAFKITDAVFWLTIGACITLNSVLIERSALKGNKIVKEKNFIVYLMNMIKMQGMLLVMSFMWALWESRSLQDWIYIMSKAGIFSAHDAGMIVVIIFSITVIGILLHYLLNLPKVKELVNTAPKNTAVLTIPSIILLALFSLGSISRLPPHAQNLILAMSNGSPNKIEKANVETGYYDRLIEGDEVATIGIGGKSFKKLVRDNPYTEAYYISNDILHRRMKANLKIEGIDHNFRSNSFGIRDKEYSVIKPAGTKRYAILGGSYEMGSGVDNDQVFEAMVEERMNKEGDKVEFFNFSAGGYYILQHVELVNEVIFKYDLDGVIYFAHSEERSKVIKNFTNLIKQKTPLKYPFLEYIQKVSGVKSYMSVLQIHDLLVPYTDTIIKWGYTEIEKKCREHNSVPVWAYLPTTSESVNMKEYNQIKGYAEKLNFVTLDMRDAYGNLPSSEVQLSEWNAHPNVLGHRLIAERFYRELKKNKSQLFNK